MKREDVTGLLLFLLVWGLIYLAASCAVTR